MKALLTIAILGLLCLGSIACASAAEEGIEFRTDICTRQQDGYGDMAITKDGKVLCVFENGTGDYCEKLSIVQVDLESLVTE